MGILEKLMDLFKKNNLEKAPSEDKDKLYEAGDEEKSSLNFVDGNKANNSNIIVITENELDEKQKLINNEYARDGLTDSVLEKQVELNQLRNGWNIPDKEYLDDDGWSQ